MSNDLSVGGELRAVLGLVLNALDRDLAEGKVVRGELAAELRAVLANCDTGRRVFGGYQTDEIKPAGHNPLMATPSDSDAKPYDALLPMPRNAFLSVDLPAFAGYLPHVVRELQAAFVKACEKVDIKVRTL